MTFGYGDKSKGQMDAYTGKRAEEPHAREGGCIWVTDNGAWMGYMAVAFSTLSQGAATPSTPGPTGDEATYPVLRPSMTKYPADVPIPHVRHTTGTQ